MTPTTEKYDTLRLAAGALQRHERNHMACCDVSQWPRAGGPHASEAGSLIPCLHPCCGQGVRGSGAVAPDIPRTPLTPWRTAAVTLVVSPSAAPRGGGLMRLVTPLCGWLWPESSQLWLVQKTEQQATLAIDDEERRE